MTTIAANRTEMAADSMASDNFADFPFLKIRQFGSSLYGGCGDLVGVVKFFDWVERGKPPKKPKRGGSSFSVMELNEHGIWIWESAFIPFFVSREYHAIGAGGQAAVALMMHKGASPSEAVEMSCDVVPSCCSRPVRVYQLADIPQSKRRKAPA